jgi:hypothetical protein
MQAAQQQGGSAGSGAAGILQALLAGDDLGALLGAEDIRDGGSQCCRGGCCWGPTLGAPGVQQLQRAQAQWVYVLLQLAERTLPALQGVLSSAGGRQSGSGFEAVAAAARDEWCKDQD